MAEAMLECVVCRVRKWRSLDPAQASEVGASGAILLACDACKRVTYWKTSDHGRREGSERRSQPETVRPDDVERILWAERVSFQTPPDKDMYRKAAAGLSQAENRTGSERREAFQRDHDRVPLRLTIRVRVNARGLRFEEETITVNVSRDGVYFRSHHPYEKGMPAYVSLNYSAANPTANIEQPATVVRIESAASDGTKGIGLLLQNRSQPGQQTIGSV